MTHYKANKSIHNDIRSYDTRECPYCTEPIEAVWDVETHTYGLPSAHFGCWHSLREGGRYAIVNSINACSGASGFDNLSRAAVEANRYTRWNRHPYAFAVIDTHNDNVLVYTGVAD